VAKQPAGKSWFHRKNQKGDCFGRLVIRREIMKKQLFGALAIGCLLALIIAVPARAQMPGTTIRASIPFDFIVRGRTFPAGKYEVMRLTDSPDVLELRNVNENRDHAAFETEPFQENRIANRSELIFNRYGNSYFLSEVVAAGEQTGRELRPSHAERQLRREMARNNREPETVAVELN
jgi:hypothetical protein